METFYRPVIDLLKRAEFELIRNGKGDHQIWAKGELKVTVCYEIKSRHLANSILKSAGIKCHL